MKDLYKWITWIVIGFALCAGFAARADFKGKYRIWYTTNGKFIWCGTDTAKDKWDTLASTKVFDSLTSCNTSPEYKALSTKYDDNSLTPPDANKPIIKPGIISIESKPFNDVRVEAYIVNFEKYAKIKIDRKKVFFGKLREAVGYCTHKQKVVIDRKYWEGKYSEYDKEMTVYHELGHCFLHRPHNDKITKKFKGEKKACVNSIMYPTALGYIDAYRCFHKNREYYLKELVAKKRQIVVKLDVYKYDSKADKWEIFKKVKGLTNKQEIKVSGLSCTFKRHGQNEESDGWFSEIYNLQCTKDYVNYVMLWHRVWYSPNGDLWDKGYGYGTQGSSSLRFWDRITKENFSIFLTLDVK